MGNARLLGGSLYITIEKYAALRKLTVQKARAEIEREQWPFGECDGREWVYWHKFDQRFKRAHR